MLNQKLSLKKIQQWHDFKKVRKNTLLFSTPNRTSSLNSIVSRACLKESDVQHCPVKPPIPALSTSIITLSIYVHIASCNAVQPYLPFCINSNGGGQGRKEKKKKKRGIKWKNYFAFPIAQKSNGTPIFGMVESELRFSTPILYLCFFLGMPPVEN